MVAVTVTSPAVRSGSVMGGPDEERALFDGPDFDVAAAYDVHGRVLLGFAINAVRDRGMAEDCVQEVFLRAWKARARFDPTRASERTWLFAIARNVIADALAARGRRPTSGTIPVDDLPVVDDDPWDRLRLIEGLSKISDEHREVVLAVHVDGLSYGELSERTGIPVPTLRTRAFYGLRALRAHLDGPEDSDVVRR